MDREAPGGPPSDVVAAFGATDPPVLLPGGQGQTWRSGSVVLKPVFLVEEVAWVAGLLDTIREVGFRLARPRRSRSGDWVVDGWAADEWVPGEQTWDNWESALPAVRALHEALAHVERPEFLDGRDNIWDEGDRAAWADELPEVYHPELHDLVEAFASLRRPEDLPSQVIHGDVTGNMLFDQSWPPAFIDFAIYWRPAAFAEAILVADALADHEAEPTLTASLAEQPESLVARAAIYRLVTSDRFAARQEGVPAHYLRQRRDAFQRVLNVLLKVG